MDRLLCALISITVLFPTFFAQAERSRRYCSPQFTPPVPGSRDTYMNYAELSAAHIEGLDYSVNLIDRGHSTSVIAIHGGRLEPLTSDIARAVAGSDMNLYTFETHLERNNFLLHITSRRFDEPRAVDLVTRSEFTLSLHGYPRKDRPLSCIGGLNQQLALRVALILVREGFQVEYPCRQFPALQDENIVNRSRKAGVQIELARRLRYDFQNDPALMERYIAALREALQ